MLRETQSQQQPQEESRARGRGEGFKVVVQDLAPEFWRVDEVDMCTDVGHFYCQLSADAYSRLSKHHIWGSRPFNFNPRKQAFSTSSVEVGSIELALVRCRE